MYMAIFTTWVKLLHEIFSVKNSRWVGRKSLFGENFWIHGIHYIIIGKGWDKHCYSKILNLNAVY